MSESFDWSKGPQRISEAYSILTSHAKRMELSQQEQEALAHIMLIWTHAGKGYAYFGREWLALKLNVHIRQVARILNNLMLHGYIKRQRRDPTSCYKTALTFPGNKLLFLLYQTRVAQSETNLFHRQGTNTAHNGSEKRDIHIESLSSERSEPTQPSLAAHEDRESIALRAPLSLVSRGVGPEGEATEEERRALRKRYQELTQEIEKATEERRSRQEEVQQADTKSQREVEKARKAELKKQLAELRVRGD